MVGACVALPSLVQACFQSTLLPGLTVELDASCSLSSSTILSSDSGLSYMWDFGDGTTGEGLKIQHHYGTPGTYVVSLQILDSTGHTVSQGNDAIDVDYTDPVWPMFLHNPQHRGESPFVGTHSPFVGTHGTQLVNAQTDSTPGIGEKWTFQTGNEIRGSAAIDKFMTIYISSKDGNLYAINPDGTEKWRYSINSGGADAPAVGLDGTIFVGSTDSNVYALNPDGTLKWMKPTGGPVYPRPTVGPDGTIYVGSDDHKLYAFNPADGSYKWPPFVTGDRIESSPAISNDGSTIYIGSFDQRLYAINAADGSKVWEFSTGASIQSSSPAVGLDGTIYFGNGTCCSTEHRVYAVNPNGTERWHFDTGQFPTGAPSAEVGSGPAIASDGTIYVGSFDFNLYALTPNGMLKWRFQTQGSVVSSPAIGADGVIYFVSSKPNDQNPTSPVDHHIYAINPDGTEQWRFLLGGDEQQSSPIIGSDGAIYIGADDGKLYAIVAVP